MKSLPLLAMVGTFGFITFDTVDFVFSLKAELHDNREFLNLFLQL